MSYKIGEKGSRGCKGYPLIDPDGKLIGCYDTRKQAELARGGAGEDTSDVDTNDSNTVVSTEKQERKADQDLFNNFGKDVTSSESLTSIFKADSVRSGQMVSWNSSGGRARGKVKRVIRSGSYNVPGTDVTISATKEDPAVVITLYRDGEPTDTTVAHRMSTLTVTSS